MMASTDTVPSEPVSIRERLENGKSGPNRHFLNCQSTGATMSVYKTLINSFLLVLIFLHCSSVRAQESPLSVPMVQTENDPLDHNGDGIIDAKDVFLFLSGWQNRGTTLTPTPTLSLSKTPPPTITATLLLAQTPTPTNPSCIQDKWDPGDKTSSGAGELFVGAGNDIQFIL